MFAGNNCGFLKSSQTISVPQELYEQGENVEKGKMYVVVETITILWCYCVSIVVHNFMKKSTIVHGKLKNL